MKPEPQKVKVTYDSIHTDVKAGDDYLEGTVARNPAAPDEPLIIDISWMRGDLWIENRDVYYGIDEPERKVGVNPEVEYE